MNRLIRIMSFVLPFFCLLMSVSYAEQFLPNETITIKTSYSPSRGQSSAAIVGDYNAAQIMNTVKNYYGGVESQANYDALINTIISNGYDYVFVQSGTNYLPFVFKGIDVAVLNTYMIFINNSVENIWYYPDNSNGYRQKAENISFCFRAQTNGSITVLDSSVSVKSLTMIDSSSAYWDGETYLYKVESEEPDSPSLPSNAEIAQAVQAFYNSDYYKNNKDFSDFMVMYNYKTQYFSFIGHNFGIDLGQVIVPSGYEYEGYSYNQDWWKFFLRNISSQVASNLWNRYYWLYSSNDFGENITFDGKGYINDMINVHWATSSIIVYSTTDYPVVKIETDDNGVFNPVEGTVPGNQYTYDENLDPTTNEYNPLEIFVPVNPGQSILGEVDFSELNKVFEENKDILNIENASWLFSANTLLVGYFTGFLLFLIVLLIILRVLGG